MPSFDIVSKVDVQELDNAVNQARKEIQTRYDFQKAQAELEIGADRVTVVIRANAPDRVQAAYEVLLQRIAKRGISLRGVSREPMDTKALGVVKQTVTLQQGLAIEKSKELVKLLKDSKMKVTASIQGDELRVTGKNRDDLQEAMALFRAQQDRMELDMQFTNFRD